MEDAARSHRQRVRREFGVLEERPRRTIDETMESNAGQGHPVRLQPVTGQLKRSGRSL
jgi:hypothetical protein